ISAATDMVAVRTALVDAGIDAPPAPHTPHTPHTPPPSRRRSPVARRRSAHGGARPSSRA
ncbi:hypothetical protein ACFV4M_42155, partial [Kitasatospora indigofera]|uniref:hypothetical protein n=1 Tax=Kitasatospora indigofera TaxID=67307 RepID=UPI00365E082C